MLFQDGNLGFEQFREIVRQNSRAQSDGDAFRAEHQRQGQFARQCHRFLVAAVVARNEIGDFIIKQFRAGQFSDAALDVTWGGGGVTREDVAIIPLAFDEITFVCQHHEGVANGGVAVRMILHRMADHIGHLDKTTVVLLMQRPENTALHGFQTIGQIRNRAVADDIAGVIEKTAVHPRMQAGLNLLAGSNGLCPMASTTSATT